MQHFAHPLGVDGSLSAMSILAHHRCLGMNGIKMIVKSETIVRLAPNPTQLAATLNPAATGLWAPGGYTLVPERWAVLPPLTVYDDENTLVITRHALHAMSKQPLHIKFPGFDLSKFMNKTAKDVAALGFVTWDIITNDGSITELFDKFAKRRAWWPDNMVYDKKDSKVMKTIEKAEKAEKAARLMATTNDQYKEWMHDAEFMAPVEYEEWIYNNPIYETSVLNGHYEPAFSIDELYEFYNDSRSSFMEHEYSSRGRGGHTEKTHDHYYKNYHELRTPILALMDHNSDSYKLRVAKYNDVRRAFFDIALTYEN